MNPTTKVDEGHKKTVPLSPYQEDLLESAKGVRKTIVDINQSRKPQKVPRGEAIFRGLRGQILFCRRIHLQSYQNLIYFADEAYRGTIIHRKLKYRHTLLIESTSVM